MKSSQKNQLFRRLLAATLIVGGAFQLAAPVLAEGTTAGTSITNRATATYEDPNNPNVPINATSNTVTITVAEVGGITVSAAGVTDSNGGQVQVGDTLTYDYIITNVGNDPTAFRIPNLATVTGPATVTGNLSISTDGGANYTPITGSERITGSIQPNASIRVRVPVTVSAGATTGNVITVQLGQTPGDQQNQVRSPDGGDVYTVDNADGSGGTPVAEVAGAPANGVREASLTQQTSVAATAQAFATILQTRTGYTDNGTTNVFTDDVLTYGLSLRVESTAPAGSTGLVPADLVATSINLNSAAAPRILISDAIPANTVLTGTPTAPTGWQVVYSTTPTSITANGAAWSTTAPGNLSTVTRIGFVNAGPIAKGTTVPDFSFSVQPTTGFTDGSAVSSYAQLFGQTSGGGATVVYDESGDQSPSNFNDNGTRNSNPVTNGVANPTADGVDSANNNTGTGPGGENNVFTLTTPSGLLSGPSGQPGAVGTTSNNDDFTNKSTLIPANTAPGTTIDPAAVSFTHTVQNTNTTPTNVSLLPLAPANPLDLRTGTLVTISSGGLSATYLYNGTTFAFQTGTGTVNGQPISATNPVRIENLAGGASANYGVAIDLPSGTPLSTDLPTQYTGDVEYGYPVRITSFVDTDTDGINDTNESQNTSIDRLYTGFLRLLKESRIIQGTGSPIIGTDGTFSTTPKTPSAGNIIEYRITYSNISTPPGGSNNVLLSASNVVITENGTANNNTWALDQDPPGSPGAGIIDTSNIVGSAVDSGPSTITFFSGNPAVTSSSDQAGTTAGADVTRYVNAVTGTVEPGVSRTFTFQRRIN